MRIGLKAPPSTHGKTVIAEHSQRIHESLRAEFEARAAEMEQKLFSSGIISEHQFKTALLQIAGVLTKQKENEESEKNK